MTDLDIVNLQNQVSQLQLQVNTLLSAQATLRADIQTATLTMESGYNDLQQVVTAVTAQVSAILASLNQGTT